MSAARRLSNSEIDMIAQDEPKIGQVWFNSNHLRYVRILDLTTVYICVETVAARQGYGGSGWRRTHNTRYSRIRRENFGGYLLHEEAPS